MSGKREPGKMGEDSHQWHVLKWRPALWMVVFGVFILVALLPIVALTLLLVAERFYGFTFELRSTSGIISLAAGSVFMAIVVGAVFLRTLLQPLRELISRTGEIEGGNRDAFRLLEQGGTREIATLGERFFRLAHRLSERSDYLTLFTTHVSHELKTPLTSILGSAELLRESGDTMQQSQRRRFLNNITEDAARLAALSTRLRELTHAEVADTGGQSRFSDVVEECTSLAMLDLGMDGDVDADVAMSEVNGRVVWQQLADNASQHGAGKLVVKAQRNGDCLKVFVGDDGLPLSVADRGKIFDPFFTTRREQGGTGMGLGITRAMLKSHNGEIVVSDEDEWKFVLKLPLKRG